MTAAVAAASRCGLGLFRHRHPGEFHSAGFVDVPEPYFEVGGLVSLGPYREHDPLAWQAFDKTRIADVFVVFEDSRIGGAHVDANARGCGRLRFDGSGRRSRLLRRFQGRGHSAWMQRPPNAATDETERQDCPRKQRSVRLAPTRPKLSIGFAEAADCFGGRCYRASVAR